MSEPRLAVRKTYKLYIGGAFPRSESGRSYVVVDSDGGFLANAAQGSRKDVRDAVVAARKAQPGWAGATAYNRGQVLYRVAEMLDGRRAQFAEEVAASEGVSQKQAAASVDAAVDRWVWYAGWADKVAQVVGLVQSGRRAVLQLLRTRAHRSRRRGRAAELLAPRPCERARPRARDGQHRWSCSRARSDRCRPSPSPRCLPPRTFPVAS